MLYIQILLPPVSNAVGIEFSPCTLRMKALCRLSTAKIDTTSLNRTGSVTETFSAILILELVPVHEIRLARSKKSVAELTGKE